MDNSIRVLSKEDVDRASDERKLYGFSKYLQTLSTRRRARISVNNAHRRNQRVA